MAAVNLLDENLVLWDDFRNGDADAFCRIRASIFNTSFVKFYLLKSLRRKLNKERYKKRSFLTCRDSEFEKLFNEIPAAEKLLSFRKHFLK